MLRFLKSGYSAQSLLKERGQQADRGTNWDRVIIVIEEFSCVWKISPQPTVNSDRSLAVAVLNFRLKLNFRLYSLLLKNTFIGLPWWHSG